MVPSYMELMLASVGTEALYKMCAFVIPFMSQNCAWMSWETALDPVLLEKIIMEACHLLTCMLFKLCGGGPGLVPPS